MIYLLHGDNEFMKRQEVAKLVGDAAVRRYDGDDLTLATLQEALMAQSLFAEAEVVVMRDLSMNTAVWAALPEVAEGAEATLILLETKPDKRTKTYKWLQKHATVTECASLTERQTPQLAAWCVAQAKAHGAGLTTAQAMRLIERLGYDQLRLDMVLQQLALVDEVTDAVIDELVPLPKTESVFLLLQVALAGEAERVQQIVAYLEAESGADGAYQTLGLLATQTVQLGALVLAGGDAARVAADFGAHPYALRQLATQAKGLSADDVALIIAALGEADMQMKTTNAAPWLLLETALARIMQR
ncbi:MAG: DNA polymerase III subunit delta [Candidatus Saccharibacteria bacterium]|nr:DNA polymerase III subunit delta [Candidatus Saccharibacteria bacterium]